MVLEVIKFESPFTKFYKSSTVLVFYNVPVYCALDWFFLLEFRQMIYFTFHFVILQFPILLRFTLFYTYCKGVVILVCYCMMHIILMHTSKLWI